MFLCPLFVSINIFLAKVSIVLQFTRYFPDKQSSIRSCFLWHQWKDSATIPDLIVRIRMHCNPRSFIKLVKISQSVPVLYAFLQSQTLEILTVWGPERHSLPLLHTVYDTVSVVLNNSDFCCTFNYLTVLFRRRTVGNRTISEVMENLHSPFSWI